MIRRAALTAALLAGPALADRTGGAPMDLGALLVVCGDALRGPLGPRSPTFGAVLPPSQRMALANPPIGRAPAPIAPIPAPAVGGWVVLLGYGALVLAVLWAGARALWATGRALGPGQVWRP